MSSITSEEKKQNNFELQALDQDAITGSSSSLSDAAKLKSDRPLWRKIHDDYLSLQTEDGDKLTLSEMFLINKDLQPVLDKNDRPWRWWNYVFFWIGGAFNLNTFQIARHLCINRFIMV